MTEADRLKAHPFMRGLADAQVGRIASCARLARFPEGAVIFREGGEADALYLMHRGPAVDDRGHGGRVAERGEAGAAYAGRWYGRLLNRGSETSFYGTTNPARKAGFFISHLPGRLTFLRAQSCAQHSGRCI